MKTKLLTICLGLITIFTSLSQLALAQNSTPIDTLLPPAEVEGYEEPGALEALPKVSDRDIMTTFIQTVLGWAMILTLIAIVVSGIYYLQSRGNEEEISKAKNIILYLIIGMAIIAAAYGIVSGVIQFDFFKVNP